MCLERLFGRELRTRWGKSTQERKRKARIWKNVERRHEGVWMKLAWLRAASQEPCHNAFLSLG
jgi:hypothetical protein